VSSNRYGYTYGGGSSYGSARLGSLKVKKILDGILEACHVATGLTICGGYDHPSTLMLSLSLDDDSGNKAGVGRLNGGWKKKKKKKNKERAEEGFNRDDGGGGRDLKSRKAAKQASKAEKKMMKKLKKQKKKNKKQSHSADSDNDNDLDGSLAPKMREMDRDGNDYEDESEDEAEDEGRNAETTTSTTAKTSSSSSPTNIYSNITSIASLTPKQNAKFFQNIFEIGRRNKVLNPSKMRGTYGKLMHLLQDAQSPSIAKSLGFTLYKDLVMVKPFLEMRGTSSILDDERLIGATMFIPTRDEYGNIIDRSIVNERVRRKKDLVDELLDEYSGSGPGSGSTITREELLLCIDSISDAIAVVESNVGPVNRMIYLLETNFDQHNKEKGFSLELRGSGNSFSSPSNRYGGGYGFGAFGSSFLSRDSSGPTLSHSHSTQYTFVWQSLHLWREVQMNMHRLWVCADDDLLSTTTSYQLLNTGQGLNRVQSCPKVGRVMRGLLVKTQKAAGSSWVGLSVIHLGDRDVPNALVFIDKYTQIPRFLKPIADFIDGIPEICADERIDAYVKDQFVGLGLGLGFSTSPQNLMWCTSPSPVTPSGLKKTRRVSTVRRNR